MQDNYLDSIKKEFCYYKLLGEKAIAQIPDNKLFWQPTPDSNCVGTIVKHLSGNMLSRWTDFLTTDGEKESRDRDSEFENDIENIQKLLDFWNKGWVCLLGTLDSLTAEDMDKIVYIRNQGHTVCEAINRQVAHYPYHIGQIVFIAKMIAENWASLTIPKNKSKDFNTDKFSKEKTRQHFSDDNTKEDHN
jgi:hypothetical protein